MLQRHTELSANIVLFSRYLRKKGFAIGPTEEADALRALSLFPLDQRELFRNALCAILAKNKFQQDHFADHFENFWKELAKGVDAKIKELPEEKNKEKAKPKTQETAFESLKNWLYGKPAKEESEVSSYSNIEVLTRKNFAAMTEEELRLIMRLLAKMARRLAHQKSRLNKVSKKRKTVDLKRTFRASMRRGGDIEELLFSEKKDKKLQLLLLCDVSKSMDLYSKFFVYLIYAFQNAYDKIETFVFSTALHRVTEILDDHEFNKAFEIIAERIPQWSGGTQIGFCFQQFMQEYGWRKLNKKTIVLILSDGWDTGEPEVLKEAMRQIHKSSKKVIWLNPLAGTPNYSSEVTGLKVALPFVDVFTSAHNLESLRAAMGKL